MYCSSFTSEICNSRGCRRSPRDTAKLLAAFAFLSLFLAALDARAGASPVPDELLDRTANCSYSLAFLDDHPGTVHDGLWQDTYLSWWSRLSYNDDRSPFYSCGIGVRSKACNQEWYWFEGKAWFEFRVEVDGESVSVRFPALGKAAPLFRPRSQSLHTVEWRVLRLDARGESTVAESEYSFLPTCVSQPAQVWGGNFESGDLRWWSE